MKPGQDMEVQTHVRKEARMEAAQILTLLDRKHRALVELHALSGQQLELIDQEQMSGLLQLLAIKQRLLGELYEVNGHLAPLRGAEVDERRWPNPETRARCQGLLARCERLLLETLEQDRRGEQLLAARRDQAEARMQQAWQGALTAQSYADTSPPVASRLDLTSEA